jgi:uroporphyrin-III C-methyltransferase/precorrin-2 dehydrogenase/sirohydrochlorin ferrochelatase
MADLLPVFLNLRGRRVLLAGGGPVAAAKLGQLTAAGARVLVVAPDVHPDIERAAAEPGSVVSIERRAFRAADADDVWFIVAAATPAVNREVADAAEARHVLVNAVDDPPNASAYLGGVVRRDGVTVAISTSGEAPALAALLRQALDRLLPRELGEWMQTARDERRKWRARGVPMDARRPMLLEALNELYDPERAVDEPQRAGDEPHSSAERSQRAGDPPQSGARHGVPRVERGPMVALVGAGPGDPALLTRAAVARLRAADLVLFDALVDERVLHLARRAQRFYVGKRAGRHALAQPEINALMIRAARRGRRVVRLKGGDPFVLGRGGEEAAALVAASVPFEIVPGVTSAVAAPALGGIPVTHRGVASAFLVVSGHDPAAFADAVSGVNDHGVTVVVLMGMAARGTLAATLVGRGWPAATPAAVVLDASRAGEDVWRGTLDDLATGRDGLPADVPATIVVGAVAALDLRPARELTERIEKCL